MWRITAVAALVAVMGIAVLSTQTTSVHACSPPLGEPLADADLIIEGRVTEYTVIKPTNIDSPELYPVQEEITVAVDRVLIGELNGTSVTFSHGAWLGSGADSAQCNFPPRDISNEYVILGLREQEDGSYVLPRFHGGFIGPEPEGEAYEAALQRIANLFEPVLPPVGTGPAPSTTHHLVASVAALGAALLAASFAIRFGTGRKT